MSGMPTVSVQVVTYNSAEHMAGCLQGVLAQTYPIDRILVIDNASADQTRERVAAFADRVEFVANATNRGFAGAHNQGVHISRSDYVLVLNPDVTLHPDYVRHLVDHLECNPQVGSATGQLLLRSAPHLIDSTGLAIKKSRRAFDRGAGEAAENWSEPAEVFGISGAAAMYRRKMIDDISGYDGQFFDESFFAYKEDVDVAWRSQLLGWRASYVPDAQALHERGWKKGSRTQQPLFIRRHSYINRYQMIVKNDRWQDLVRHLPFVLQFEAAGLLYSVLREPQLLLAWRMFARALPELRQKRRWIQSRQTASARDVIRLFQ